MQGGPIHIPTESLPAIVNLGDWTRPRAYGFNPAEALPQLVSQLRTGQVCERWGLRYVKEFLYLILDQFAGSSVFGPSPDEVVKSEDGAEFFPAASMSCERKRVRLREAARR